MKEEKKEKKEQKRETIWCWISLQLHTQCAYHSLVWHCDTLNKHSLVHQAQRWTQIVVLALFSFLFFWVVLLFVVMFMSVYACSGCFYLYCDTYSHNIDVSDNNYLSSKSNAACFGWWKISFIVASLPSHSWSISNIWGLKQEIIEQMSSTCIASNVFEPWSERAMQWCEPHLLYCITFASLTPAFNPRLSTIHLYDKTSHCLIPLNVLVEALPCWCWLDCSSTLSN